MTFTANQRIVVRFAKKTRKGIFMHIPKSCYAKEPIALVRFDGNVAPTYVHLADIRKAL